MEQKLERYIRSGHPGICIVSLEETRVEAGLKRLAEKLEYGLYSWSLTDGLVDVLNGNPENAQDVLEAVEAIGRLPEQSLVLMRDLHLHLEEGNPVLLRAVKDVLMRCKTQGKVLIACGCRKTLPPELEREFVVVEFRLPGRDDLGKVLEGICESAGLDSLEEETKDAVLESAAGLTCSEAENAFALSVVETGTVDAAIVGREKAHTIGNGGILEVCDASESLADIGGLDRLKDWLDKRRAAFTRKAAEYGLPTPKGMLILGVPGTGKSLTAKATDYCHERLLSSPAALEWLDRHGLRDEQALRKFRIGFADRSLGLRIPENNRREGGILRGRLKRLGLLRPSGHEHFGGTLMLPVPGPDGRLAGIYGRRIGRRLRRGALRELWLPPLAPPIWKRAGLVGREAIVCLRPLDAARTLASESIAAGKDGSFTRRDVRVRLGCGLTRTRTHIERLHDLGLVSLIQSRPGGAFRYRIVENGGAE